MLTGKDPGSHQDLTTDDVTRAKLSWVERRRKPFQPPPKLSGLFHKYAHVRGNGFWAEARRERRAYPEVDL